MTNNIANDIKFFLNYNYSLMEKEDYKEDTVREEIIVPLIKLFGYKIDGENIIVRSKKLQHPYLTVGSSQRKISYIPDYLLKVNSKITLVLDAKSPNENIFEGKHVEQAYSYAIHPEIRTNLFALCNGKEFSLFSLNQINPILHFELKNINKFWEKLIRMIHPSILAKTDIVKYLPDFGLYILRIGLTAEPTYIFPQIPTKFMAKLDEKNITCVTTCVIDKEEFAMSIDFNIKYLNDILSGCSKIYANKILLALSNAPFIFKGDNNDDEIVFGVKSKLSDSIMNNNEEQFVPFLVTEIIL